MKKISIFFILLLFPLSVATVSFAQEGITVDSDLDALVDEDERNVHRTDSNNPDTDGDGYFDGVEVKNGTDPLDKNSYFNVEDETGINLTPSWAWYVSRATALISFFLLYVVIFLGLTVRLPFLNKIFSPLTSLRVHAWLSVQALFFVFVHASALVFDKFYKFTWVEAFIPFAHPEEGNFVAMGVIGFYAIILLILTSYFRHLMSHRIWRISHFLNVALYVFAIIHSLKLGTDLQSGIGRNVFVWSNVALGTLFVLNLEYQAYSVIKRKIFAKKTEDNIM